MRSERRLRARLRLETAALQLHLPLPGKAGRDADPAFADRQQRLPLKTIETDFAVDSTGFSTARHVRWFDEKYGKERSGHEWVKAHIITGVKTAIVPSVKILGKYAGDVTQFAPLVKDAAANLRSGKCPVTKRTSRTRISNWSTRWCGPFIPFKSNSTQGEAGSVWERMFFYSQFRKDEFFAHYHKRSNVESTFSAIKRKFGDSVRSRSDAAQVNEVLGKILAHNIVVNIHAQCELGIESVFWPEEAEKTAILPFSGNVN